jgi:DNA helicase-2/ATP-dependent DNA helicase PcrA
MNLPSYLFELNDEQRAAASQLEGQLLILAGAGSGKTRVLTRRIAYLLHSGVAAENVLAVTFTNKAAHEMKERIVDLVGEAGEDLWVSTFHSSCARILRQDIEPLGWTKRFSIYDDDDQTRLMREIIADLGYATESDDGELKPMDPREALSAIDRLKNTGFTLDELIAHRRVRPHEARLWREYSERMRAADALDFNDLINFALELFRNHEDVLMRWRSRFQYILVDEYQDTNRAQYQFLRYLAGDNGNLAVVGDDDQSIYGFRGADIQNILGFQRDYPSAVIVRLEQNYRCTKNILSVANCVVQRNAERMDKTLWTDGAIGDQVQFVARENPDDEARWIARDAIPKLRRRGYQFSDMAIIYRTNATARVFEPAVRDARIPYRIVGSKKFTDRREVRDIVGYVRVLINPADDAAFLRVVNVPSRGIGAKTLAALREESTQRGDPLLKTAAGRPTGGTAQGIALQKFVQLVGKLGEAVRDLPTAELVERVIVESGYRDMLTADEDEDTESRLAALAELVRDAGQFEAPPDATTPFDRTRAWLDRIALVGQDEELPEGGVVTMMTVHNAKGLEYPIVFVVHMMEGQFPHGKSLEAADGVAEECRLAYVAFTRAKARLFVTRSRNMWANGGFGPKVPKPVARSRFIEALPEAACAWDDDAAPAPVAIARASNEPKAAVQPRSVAFAVPDDHRLVDVSAASDLAPGAIVHCSSPMINGFAEVISVQSQTVRLRRPDGSTRVVSFSGTTLQRVVA